LIPQKTPHSKEGKTLIVKLAGYNVEADLLENLDTDGQEALTPETFSAAYARISRSAEDITALRRQARVDVKKARKSNQKIIFKMGHHSVAEHAVFNWDIIGISRLALEEIEQFRLVSYTEKSQRYVTLEGDYLLPEEIENTESEQLFKDTVALQNAFYEKSFNILKDFIFNKYPHLTEKRTDRNMLEGWAKEDARYILALAVEGQVGMTINARNLEHLFRRFHLSRRAEVREIGKRMYEQVEKIAPSIFLFAQPSQFNRDLKDSFKDNFAGLKPSEPVTNRATKLVHYSENGDDIILASFLSVFNSVHFNEALEIIKNLDNTEKEKIYRDLFKHMEFFDSTPREFEMADITFEAVISASNFAQLKRHRLATLLPGDYNIKFGNVIPENIKRNGLEKEFLDIIDRTNSVYLKLKERHGDAADYILSNSHRRHIVMKMNLREVFHFIRLRSDKHTQWDIRQLADQILEQVKTVMPLSSLLLCGKSDFVELFESTYNRKPEFDI
jgi:flavin-dependent thymidylate synthase